jgi:hypothetical protein
MTNDHCLKGFWPPEAKKKFFFGKFGFFEVLKG